MGVWLQGSQGSTAQPQCGTSMAVCLRVGAAANALRTGAGVPLPLVCAWPLPNLLTPESRTSEPEPKAVDPFADAALEDALSDLIERSALAGGIDL